jgi:hypothetical protein
MSRAPPPPTFKAWLVAYVDPGREPPSIFEAGIFPDNRPTKAERHNGFAQLVLLQTEAASYSAAADQIKQILSGPEWRWLYRVPVLTAGFQHLWAGDVPARACRVCGVRENDRRTREAGGRDPDRCLVSHLGTCSGCAERRPILQGDALCVVCRYPITSKAS